jgi:hypothetical protein
VTRYAQTIKFGNKEIGTFFKLVSSLPPLLLVVSRCAETVGGRKVMNDWTLFVFELSTSDAAFIYCLSRREGTRPILKFPYREQMKRVGTV